MMRESGSSGSEQAWSMVIRIQDCRFITGYERHARRALSRRSNMTNPSHWASVVDLEAGQGVANSRSRQGSGKMCWSEMLVLDQLSFALRLRE